MRMTSLATKAMVTRGISLSNMYIYIVASACREIFRFWKSEGSADQSAITILRRFGSVEKAKNRVLTKEPREMVPCWVLRDVMDHVQGIDPRCLWSLVAHLQNQRRIGKKRSMCVGMDWSGWWKFSRFLGPPRSTTNTLRQGEKGCSFEKSGRNAYSTETGAKETAGYLLLCLNVVGWDLLWSRARYDAIYKA